MNDCVVAMEAVAKAVPGGRAPEQARQLEAHCAVCSRCREAYADALACGEALRGAGGDGVLRDAVAWERALFLRLLAEEAAPEGRRPTDWSRLALGLGRGPVECGSTGEWARWKRGAAAGGSL